MSSLQKFQTRTPQSGEILPPGLTAFFPQIMLEQGPVTTKLLRYYNEVLCLDQSVFHLQDHHHDSVHLLSPLIPSSIKRTLNTCRKCILLCNLGSQSRFTDILEYFLAFFISLLLAFSEQAIPFNINAVTRESSDKILINKMSFTAKCWPCNKASSSSYLILTLSNTFGGPTHHSSFWLSSDLTVNTSFLANIQTFVKGRIVHTDLVGFVNLSQ